MDAQRFDRLTRLLAAGADRRRVLRVLLGTGAGLLTARVGVAQEAPPNAAVCVKDDDCVAPDSDPCTGVLCADGVCSPFIASCAPGFACCGNGQCCATTVCQGDADCPSGGDPCTRVRCQDGACLDSRVLCPAGSTCCGSGECCPLPCLTDVDCAVTGGDPCTGARCLEGSCVSFTVDCGQDACCGGVCLEPCPTGQTYDEGCRCVWVPAARPWRRFLRDRD